MPTQTLDIAFLSDAYIPDGLNTTFINEYRIAALRVLAAVHEIISAELTTRIVFSVVGTIRSSVPAYSDLSLAPVRRVAGNLSDIESKTSSSTEVVQKHSLSFDSVSGSMSFFPDSKEWKVRRIKRASIDVRTDSDSSVVLNVVSSIGSSVVATGDTFPNVSSVVSLRPENIIATTENQSSFFVRRMLRVLSKVVSKVEDPMDLTRTRSIGGEWDCTGDLVWNYPHLFLIRRPTIHMLSSLLCTIDQLFFMKEGNPAVRVEPLMWYKKRLDPGDIVIPENEWI